MPLQYIKTLGGLIINDGNPDNDVNLTTGPPGSNGKVRINGHDGSGGGGGGNVTLAGNNAFTGNNSFTGTLISTNQGDAFQFNGAGNTVSTVGQFKAKFTNAAAESVIRQDGTATFTGLVKCGDLGGQGTGNAIETKDDIQCDGSIKLVPVAAGNDSILLDGASMKISGRDIEAIRTPGGQGPGGEVLAHTLKAAGAAGDPSSIECSAEGSVRAQKYEVGNNANFPNHINIFGRETAPGGPADEAKTDCIIEMLGGLAPAGGQAGGTGEVYFENTATIVNGPQPEYNRLCGINQDGFVSSRPIKYIGLKPSLAGTAKQINYAYCAEVYDLYKNAGANDPNTGQPLVPTRTILTRLCNDLTNDGGGLGFYTLFSMTDSTDVKGNGAFPDAGFQSKYPQHKGATAGEAAPIITWNVGDSAQSPGVNHFVPVDPDQPQLGFDEALKRKHWRISFKQVGSMLSTVVYPAAPNPGSKPIGTKVLEGFEGYVDVCIAEFPETGNGELQYKDVCYTASTNFLNVNTAIAAGSTRTLDRGQVRMARRNQNPIVGPPAVPGGWQFFIDFPSWDLGYFGGTDSGTQMNLNFTFTCLQ